MKEKETGMQQCLVFASGALARETQRMAEAAFKEFKLGFSHVCILDLVCRNSPVGIGTISKELILTPSTVTRLCEKLDTAGYIKRSLKGRSVKISPTQKAEKLMPALQKKWAALNSSYGEILGQDQQAKLINRNLKAARKISVAR